VGDPIRDVAAYRLIASYAPYENVKAQAYSAHARHRGHQRSARDYWEPAKWVAKLRAMKTNDSRIALVTRMSAGHFGAAGRFEWLEEVASIFAFALDAPVLPGRRRPPSMPRRRRRRWTPAQARCGRSPSTGCRPESCGALAQKQKRPPGGGRFVCVAIVSAQRAGRSSSVATPAARF